MRSSAETSYLPAQMPPQRWSNWYLTALKSAVGLLLVLLIVLFWLLRQNEAEEQRSTLIADVLWLEQSISFHLEGNAEQLRQLATNLANEHDGRSVFELNGKYLLNNSPDIQQLIWVDAAQQVVASLPTQTLPRLGVDGLGNEVQARSIAMASKLGKTVYTEAYSAADVTQVEVYSPIFANGRYRGSLIGVYSLNTLLKTMVPWWFAEKYQVTIQDASGNTLASKSKISAAMTKISYSVPFDPPGFGLVFQVSAYRNSTNMAQTMIAALIILLAAAVLLSLLALRGHIRRRLAAEYALRSEHAFRNAMENSLTVGMRARNLEGRIIYANPAFCQMTGYSIEELMNARPPMPYWPTEEIDRAQAFHDHAIDWQMPREGVEFRFVRKDGTPFDALVYEAPLIDADGKHTGWMASIVDVTARKKVEDLWRSQQERLQFTSRLITMGELASSLAHELNQPLAAIANYNASCRNKLETGRFTVDDLKGIVAKLAVQVQRAGRIVGRVHDFVRKSEPKLAPCDLALIVDDSIGFIEATAKLARIRITHEFPEHCPPLMADRAMLEQVMLNLMRNGLEAMRNAPSERRRLHVALSEVEGQMLIRVIDFGEGIPPEVQSKLFTPFFTTKAEGMGMGLNICRSIVEFHQGRLWVEDNPEGGTIACVTLPIATP